LVAHLQRLEEVVAGVDEQDLVAETEPVEHVHQHDRRLLHAGEQHDVVAQPADGPANPVESAQRLQRGVRRGKINLHGCLFYKTNVRIVKPAHRRPGRALEGFPYMARFTPWQTIPTTGPEGLNRTSLKTSLATSPRTKLSAAARSRVRAASTSGRRTTCPARRPAESIR